MIVGRRTGLGGLVAAIARDAARQQRFAETERRRQVREAERIERNRQRTFFQNQRADLVRSQREQERFEKAQDLENRENEASELNEGIARQVDELGKILRDTLVVNDTIDFDSLRIRDTSPAFEIPSNLRSPKPKPNLDDFIGRVEKLSGLRALVPGVSQPASSGARPGRTVLPTGLGTLGAGRSDLTINARRCSP